ncbi:(5-formylfuran-3-yl)methyl phosphate synthase [Methanoculleus sp. FWC-SCC3]|uniref:(5-formylfuran-3-yl)methyl phosphate synthase n=1 Tax=Methanoculleus methanifontis TaxID=2584086 RepID=A0ABT8M4M7_9EURY|nr:(5-formylfuran-3-yl)methyl phosphate synthase [Methanoculleus sp. FWC-SCC3]MDN7013553.1 (5-formylfuran-3-yl)methyl phosphate synthase [Methanoculleus sp. FWC-SCC3]
MQLLVSPSSIEEARSSLSADIIDVKKPSEGSLGANFPWIIRGIKEIAGKKPVSAAIGDNEYKPGTAALSAYGAAHAGADYVKVGLMFDGEDRAREVIEAVTTAVKREFPEKYVVIATYADFARIDTISPLAISALVADAGADVAMIDTGIKDGKSLFEFMDEETLTRFSVRNRELGLQTALAGSLKFEDLDALKRINPEIIGVRGMVCGGDRSTVVRAELVEKAMMMLR